ncbi:MAG TPA: hypothetical protein VMU15_21695 [Anaeromyxobacter sp.]|nr:hypothetical protein [Anaeromyxobacter sp.]
MPSLATIAWVLGAWTAISVVASPVVVVLFRAQARLNAHLTSRLRRHDWTAALGA